MAITLGTRKINDLSYSATQASLYHMCSKFSKCQRKAFAKLLVNHLNEKGLKLGNTFSYGEQFVFIF